MNGAWSSHGHYVRLFGCNCHPLLLRCCPACPFSDILPPGDFFGQFCVVAAVWRKFADGSQIYAHADFTGDLPPS